MCREAVDEPISGRANQNDFCKVNKPRGRSGEYSSIVRTDVQDLEYNPWQAEIVNIPWKAKLACIAALTVGLCVSLQA